MKGCNFSNTLTDSAQKLDLMKKSIDTSTKNVHDGLDEEYIAKYFDKAYQQFFLDSGHSNGVIGLDDVKFSFKGVPCMNFFYEDILFCTWLNETFFYNQKQENDLFHSYIEDSVFEGNIGKIVSVLLSSESYLAVN
jgi:hypothetical protein